MNSVEGVGETPRALTSVFLTLVGKTGPLV